MRKNPTVILLLRTLILLVLLTIMPAASEAAAKPREVHVTARVSSGMDGAMPNNRPLSFREELEAWHTAPWVRGECPVLAQDIMINKPLTLSETDKSKELGAIEHVLRVTTGGILTLNNSKLVIQGPQTVIVVEAGGQLLLQKGAIYTAKGSTAIVVEKGGSFVKSQTFLIDGGIIFDKNDPPTTLPVPPPTKPNPPLPVILNTIGFDRALTCMAGAPPALSDYPSTEWVAYETAGQIPMQKELPVKWKLDTVDFGTAGTYAVKGIFSAEVLSAHGLSNPNLISPTLQLTVLKPAPVDTLIGHVLSVGSAGNCHIRLTLPLLPKDVTALYLYRSTDGQNWQKAVQEVYVNGNVPSFYDNFLPYGMSTPTAFYVQYRYQTDYCPIWLRVEVVGSAVSGISNIIQLVIPESAKPGEVTNTGEVGADGSFDGNRGGGGQSEEKREFQKTDEISGPGYRSPTIENTPSIDRQLSVLPVQQQQEGGMTAKTESTAGESTESKPRVGAARPESSSESKMPVSTPSDVGEAASLALVSPIISEPPEKIETVTEEEISVSAEGRAPILRSKGVFLTVGATAFAAAALLLLRQMRKHSDKNSKRKS